MDRYQQLLRNIGLPDTARPGMQGYGNHPNQGLHLGQLMHPLHRMRQRLQHMQGQGPDMPGGGPYRPVPAGQPGGVYGPPPGGPPQGGLYGQRPGGGPPGGPPQQPPGNAFGLQGVQPGNAPGHSGAPGQLMRQGQPGGPGSSFSEDERRMIARAVQMMHGGGAGLGRGRR